MTTQKACKVCGAIVEEADVCPKCRGQLSRDWQGYVIIIDYTKSEIATRMGVRSNGTYALKVR